jgi:tetratricopeptide (TPR) repeat protein
MQSKNLKSLANESVKKISDTLKEHKKGRILKILLLIFIPIFLILLLIVSFNISNLLYQVKRLKIKSENRTILKLAEKSYKDGYLENSAVYYQTYVDSDIPKVEKIIAYKRLFEIAVIRKKLNESLTYLDKLEEIDKNILEVYINRIKIYLRLNEFEKAKEEINKNRSKLKKSVEYKNITGVYYIRTGDYKKALEIFESIPLNKREFEINKKIIQCMINLGKYDNCLDYIKKIEKKYKVGFDPEIEAEIIILKQTARIMKGDYNGAIDELKRAESLTNKYKDITHKLILYSGMSMDLSDDVYAVIESNETKFVKDPNLLKVIGDYYIYKEEYARALFFYENLKNNRELSKDELMSLADIYYHTGDYIKSIESMENLFKKYDFKTPALYKNLSMAYSKMNDFQNEIFFLKEGISEFPKDIDFYIRLAKIFIDKGDYNEALYYINEAKAVYKRYDDVIYDKRLDALYVFVIEQSNKKIQEDELLNLREKETKNPDYYFKVIQYYINKKKYIDAKRELDTAGKLALDDYQKQIFNIFDIIISLNLNDKKEYDKASKEYITKPLNDDNYRINLAIIYIYNDDYDKALEILSTLTNPGILDENTRAKVTYLQALCNFYKHNYTLSQKLIDRLPEIEKSSKRVSYLQRLIKDRYDKSVSE